jgi:alcohol dehydrogenase
MAEALGGIYDIPHGVANACLLPDVMEFNCQSNPQKFARVARALNANIDGLDDVAAASAGVQAVRELNKKLKIPSLKELKIPPECFAMLADKSLENVACPSNPRDMSKQDLLDIFMQAYEYDDSSSS